MDDGAQLFICIIRVIYRRSGKNSAHEYIFEKIRLLVIPVVT